MLEKMKSNNVRGGNDMKKILICGFALISLFIFCEQIWSQPSYPARPIDLIVVFPAGGSGDVSARLLAKYFTEKWGVQISVINKPGGGGVPGVLTALKAKPDGYTMLLDGHACSSNLAAFYKGTLPFDWRDRSWCATFTVGTIVYQVRKDVPWKTLKEIDEFIMKNPKKLRWGVGSMSGIGTAAGAQFFKAGNIDIDMINHVVFSGEAPTLTALAGGHVDFAAQHFATSWGMMESKKIVPIAVISEKRLTQMPDVPTVAEAGYPMLDIKSWNGISGPPKLPKPIVDFWSNELAKATKDPAFIELFRKADKEIYYENSKELEEHALKEYQKYVELAKYLKIKTDK
jgi:tripartite-type tricarboxylate transporter receptor subunit TctC